MPATPQTFSFTFPTQVAAERASAQLRLGKAIATEVKHEGDRWSVTAICEYPEWALPHADASCRAFAEGLGGEFLGVS